MIFEKTRLKLWMNALRRSGKILAFRDPVSFQEQMKDTSRICICMPRDDHHFYEARECLQQVKDHKHWVLLILNKEHELTAEHSGKTEIYPPDTKRDFPVREDRVSNIPHKFDIAVDLSPKPDPTTAYITGSRGKKMTIGLKSGDLDAFYTMLINPHDDYKTSVRTMLRFAGFELREE
jgi:hypothetical protein